MRRDYIALWGILALAFVLFLCLSVCGDLKVGPLSIKSSDMARAVLDTGAVSAGDDTLAAGILAPVAADSIEPDSRVTLDTCQKNILIIGDSMLEGLFPRLAAYCEASGYNLYTVIWYSSTTELYGEARLLSDYIRKLAPGYIFLSLGGNELFVADVAKKRAPFVRSILSEIGDIPYLWIGPPNWKEDTGINALIDSSVPKGCFFTSNGMHFDRKRDGAHPTAKSSAEWMDSIMRWMPANAKYILPVNAPVAEKARGSRIFLHQPGPITNRPK